MKEKINALVLSFCLLFCCAVMYAKKAPPSPNKGRPVIPPGLEKKLPINNVIPFLFASGIIYGFYELKRRK